MMRSIRLLLLSAVWPASVGAEAPKKEPRNPFAIASPPCTGGVRTCINGLFNKATCSCDCIPPFRQDANGECLDLDPTGSVGGNPWAQCAIGDNCPWWPNPALEGACATGQVVPSGIWQLYPTQSECCAANFKNVEACNDLPSTGNIPYLMRPCSPTHECMHGSTCLYEDRNGNPYCDCSTATSDDGRPGVSYAGTYCEFEALAYCPHPSGSDHYCINGGRCVSASPPRCECPSGYEGQHCQFALDELEMEEDEDPDRDDEAAPPFSSNVPPAALNNCSSPNEKCQNNALCAIEDNGNEYCNCASATSDDGRPGVLFAGRYCEFETTSYCGGHRAHFCVNGGICSGGTFCRCPTGFRGRHCEFLDGGVEHANYYLLPDDDGAFIEGDDDGAFNDDVEEEAVFPEEEEAFFPREDDFVGDDDLPDEFMEEQTEQEEVENRRGRFCGFTFEDANSMCRKPCPAGSDAECIDLDVSSGRKLRCFSFTGCASDNEVATEPQSSPTDFPTPLARSEYDILVSFCESTGGGSWFRNDFWKLKTVSFCRWNGITCDVSKSFDTVSRLELPANNLRGTFYADILELPNLSVLDLGTNELYGEIPEEIGTPEKLKTLVLSNNSMRGAIPSSLSRLPLLEELDLRANSFGQFRISNDGYRALRSLRLDNNRLDGTISHIIDTMTALEVLTMRGNSLTGYISRGLASLTNLTKLDLSFNIISGVVPDVGLEQLEIDVAANKLRGIDPGACLNEKWNSGNVGRYGCDGIACPIGTSNHLGRRTQTATCDSDPNAIYIASVKSKSPPPSPGPLGGDCQIQCLNGGICRGGSSVEYQYCVCPPGFTGKQCELNRPTPSYARPTPRPSFSFPPASCQPECLNGGVCRYEIGFGKGCICPPGFWGAQCQSIVTKRPTPKPTEPEPDYPRPTPKPTPFTFTGSEPYYDWDSTSCIFYATNDLGRLSTFEPFCGGGAGYADIGFEVRDITVDPDTLRAIGLIMSEIIEFDLKDGSIVRSLAPKVGDEAFKANFGGIELANGKLYGAGELLGPDDIYNATTLYEMDPVTAEINARGPILPTPVVSLAGINGQTLYAVSSCDHNSNLYEIDLDTKQSTTICEDLPACIESLAYHPGENALYGGLSDGCIARIIPERCQVQGCRTQFGWASHFDQSVTGLSVVCPRAPSPVPSTMATTAPRHEECEEWLFTLLQSDTDASQSISEREFHSFLTSINGQFNKYESFAELPWTVRVVHKSLACHCEKLGYGDGCCSKEGPEVVTVGLADGSDSDAAYQQYFCQQMSFALAKEVDSPAPGFGPSNWPIASPAVLSIPPTDDVFSFAHLSKFYHSTSGESWVNNTNWMQMDGEDVVCTWHGIACDDSGNIIGINLPHNGLTGNGLRYLDYMPSIQHLNLTGNELGGSIPPFAAHQMEFLDLANNRFVGSLASNFLEASEALVHIDLSENWITGHLHEFSWPSGFYQELKYLNFSSNDFSSSIPVEIGTMTALEHIDLSSNRFTWEFQEPYYRDLRNLTSLRLSRNKLLGSLPSYEHYPNLRELDVSHNEMKGSIPTNFFGNASLGTVISLDISHNYFIGTFPDLPHIRLNVNAVGNQFEDIAEEACSRSEWNNGDVAAYGCDGIMCAPETYNSIGRASPVDSMCVNCPSAAFYGTTQCLATSKRPTQRPSGVGEEGFFDGRAPTQYPSGGIHDGREYDALKLFYAYTNGRRWFRRDNWMSDEVSVCQWFGVTCNADNRVIALTLPSNGLDGAIIFPKLFSQLRLIEVVDLSDNRLSYRADFVSYAESLTEVNLRDNLLSGPLPAIERLPRLERLILANNSLTGTLADGYSTLASSLVELDLGANMITGTLVSFREAEQVMHLNVSKNLLTGTLPEDLLQASFTNPLNPPKPHVVDLSFNLLEGVVPAFEVISLQLNITGNSLGALDQEICERSSWNMRGVYRFGCDSVACPIGTANAQGRQTSDMTPCEPCPTAAYIGTAGCPGENPLPYPPKCPCQNGAKCIPDTTSTFGYTCDCPTASTTRPQYAGQFCQYEVTSFCSELNHRVAQYAFCTNGGVCREKDVPFGDSHRGCDCPQQFSGDHCEIAGAGPTNAAPSTSKPEYQPSSSPIVLEKTFRLYEIPPYLMVTTSSNDLQSRSTVSNLEDISSSFLLDVFERNLGIEDSIYITTLRLTDVDPSELESGADANQTANATRRRRGQSTDTVETFFQVDGIVGIRDGGLLNGTDSVDGFLVASLGDAFQSRDELFGLIQGSSDPALQSVSLVELSADLEICPNNLKCHHGSECVEQEGLFACNCSAAYYYEAVDGLQCEFAATQICSNGSFCVNGGECIESNVTGDESSQPGCSCQDPYEGSTCQLRKDDMRLEGSKTAPSEESSASSDSLSAGDYAVFVIIGVGLILTLLIIVYQLRAKRAPKQREGKQTKPDTAGAGTDTDPEAMEAGLGRKLEEEKEREEGNGAIAEMQTPTDGEGWPAADIEEQGDAPSASADASSTAAIEGVPYSDDQQREAPAGAEEEKEEIEPFDGEEDFTVTHLEEAADENAPDDMEDAEPNETTGHEEEDDDADLSDKAT